MRSFFDTYFIALKIKIQPLKTCHPMVILFISNIGLLMPLNMFQHNAILKGCESIINSYFMKGQVRFWGLVSIGKSVFITCMNSICSHIIGLDNRPKRNRQYFHEHFALCCKLENIFIESTDFIFETKLIIFRKNKHNFLLD